MSDPSCHFESMPEDTNTTSLVDGQPRQRQLTINELDLALDRIARELGYRDGKLPDHVGKIVEHALDQAQDLIAPRFLWLPLTCNVDTDSNTVRVGGRALNVGKMIRAHVRGAQAIALFVATIGADLEKTAREQMKDTGMLEGYTLDAIGSSAAEAVADAAEADIHHAAEAAGWANSNRLSPGYCQWATHEQANLFALLPDQPCGIELTRSSLMVPIKSVSGIIGLGPAVKYLPYMCSMCDMTTCPRRQTTPHTP